MGAFSGPKIVEDGLVLALDGANYKSFKGEVTTNLISDPFALSGNPSPVTWSGYEATVTRTNSFPSGDMYNISPTWLKIEKTSSSNGRVAVLGVNGLQTGVDYCCSFYAYSNDTNLTNINWLSDNSSVSTIQSSIAYTSSDIGTIKRVQVIFRSVSGSQLNVLRLGASNPVGTTAYITGIQVEQKSYPTKVVNGTRGSTVATGGGWKDLIGSNNGELVNGVRESSDNLGALIFDGTDDYVTLPNFTYTPYCLDFWVYNNTQITANDTSVGGPSTYQTLFRNFSGLQLSLGGWSSLMTNETLHIYSDGKYTYINQTIPVGYHNWVYNWNGSNYDIWVDGVKKTAIAGSTGHATLAQQSSSNYVGYNAGSYYFYGNIYGMKIYTSQLSDAQVQQNFNATRSRFGI